MIRVLDSADSTLVEWGRQQQQQQQRNGTKKNLTDARTRTQVPGFSSADALSTKLRVPVTEPEF